MKLTRTLSLFLALAATTAIASADKPAPPPAEKPAQRVEVTTAEAERFFVFMTKVVDAVKTNATDCAKMAAGMNKVIDANADVIQMAKDAKSAGKKLPREYEEKIATKAKEMEPGMEKCQKDPAVSAAIERISTRKKVVTPPAPPPAAPPAKK